MDSTAHQWTQEFVVGKSMADHNIGAAGSSACTRLQQPPPPSVMDQRKILARPQKDHVINCPRCQSTNTKFCYYNNYSLTQPRYFCKTCRRYWTEGGTLRNVPVGGGSRKNKKPAGSTSNNSPSSSSMVTVQRIPDLNPPSSISHFSSRNPNKIDDDQGGHDLNLGYNNNQLLGQQLDYHHHHGSNIPQFLDFPKIESSSSSSALNFLRNNGINGARAFNSFIPMAPTNTLEGNNALFASSLGFSVEDGNINGNRSYGNHNDHDQTTTTQESINGSLMFTLGSASDKQHSSTNNTDQADHQEKGHHHENANGFWNGMIGGGSW